MPLLESIIDLFTHGVVSIAEQFVRGTTRAGTLSDILRGRFGDEFAVPESGVQEFTGTVLRASRPANIIAAGGVPSEDIIPDWPQSGTPGQFIHTGLVNYTVNAASGEPAFSTHTLFKFHEDEISKLQAILDKLKRLVNTGDSGPEYRYPGDIDRIEQLLEFHRQVQSDIQASVNMYSVFKGQ